MLFAAHAISGGVAGSYFSNPALSFLLGLILHFILDWIPHYDTTDGGKFTVRQIALVAIDIILGLLIIFLLIKPSELGFWCGAFGGILPDLFDVNPLIRNRFRATSFGRVFHRFHEKCHTYKPSAVLGLLTQVLIILFSYLLARPH